MLILAFQGSFHIKNVITGVFMLELPFPPPSTDQGMKFTQ